MSETPESATLFPVVAEAPGMATMSDYCNKVTYPETLETPPEFCDEPTVEGADYCEYHLEEE